jgi:hypothetical protein
MNKEIPRINANGMCWTGAIYRAALSKLWKTLGVYVYAHPSQGIVIQVAYDECNEPFRLPIVSDPTCPLQVVEFVGARNHDVLFVVDGLAMPACDSQLEHYAAHSAL